MVQVHSTIKIVGGDTSKYNFYHRLQGGAYAGLPSPVGGVTTLTSGTYEIKAEPKSGSGAPAVAPVSGLQIRSLKQTVDYTLTDLPSKCTGQLPGLRVNVTSGSYPLLFSLYDNTGTTPVPGFYRQTSNVFTNVPPGNYKVKVEDFCAITGGDATVKGHVMPNTMIDFTETYLNTIQEYGCDYLSFSQLGIKGDNLRLAFEAGSLPFPFTLKFELKEPAPSTIVHTVSRTFNNQNDVSLFLYAHPYVTNLLLVKENLRGERIPKKAGQWEIKAIVSACGVNKTLTAKTVTFKSLFNDFAVYEGGASETTACHSTNIVLSNTTRMDMSLDIYVVVDQAPAGFKYEEAGFFKLTTSNPLLHNKYVKKIQYYGAANDAYPIVAPEFINQGDQFKFRVVDAECDPNRNSGELPLTITHPTNNEPTDLWIHNTQSCRGVTSTGAPYGTFLFSRTRGSEITEIKILSFDGNPSDLPFTLPYTLPTSNRIDSKTWALYDLPAGKYDISVTNRCGNTKVWPNQKLFGETFSFTWSEGCTPSLNAIIGQPELRAYQSYSVNYFVQHFENGEWKDVERINLNSSALSTSYNKTFTETRLKEGKFRVLRKIKYGDNGKICDIVVSEKEYIGDLKNPTAIGAGCPNGKYHIAIIANGGTPPYTYEWVSTTPVGSTTPVPSGHPAQTNDNFFVDLTNSDPNTTYTFAVTDACGNRRTVDTSLAGVATPEIKVDAGENAFYCTGQQATLSLPNIKGITVKWYRSDAPSTILGTGNSLTITVAPDDFVTGNTYKVELEMPARPDVASCISAAINNNFAYQFKSKNFVTPIPPTRKDITICAENNTTQDLTQLFQNIPTLSPGVTATIREKTGAIYVPDNNTITIGNMKGEYTFVYTLYEPCRKVIGTPVEATLTVNRKINPNTKPNIKICDPSITMDVLKSLVLAGSPEVASLALDFHWYQNNTDAQNQQNESAGSYAISLSPGQKKTVYVRYSKLGYCSGEPKLVEVEREATVAPKALTNPDCSVTTVRTLKALVDPVDSANVIIYKNGTELGDDMLIEEYTPTMYTYSKRLYQCTPPAQPLTFSYKERTAAAPQQVGVCTFRGYQNAPYVKVADIKSKIQVQYVGKTIRIYQNNSELSAANAAVNFTATDVYFTVEETGKCPSLQQKVTLQQAPFSVATPLPTLSICGDTTIAELKAEIGAQGLSNVKIYSSSLATEESDDKFVVWGNPYYYRVVETGKCPSDFIPLAFTNKGNKTNATPKLYEVCIPQGNTAKIADLKSVITGGEVKIFKRNNDNTWSDPLDDNTTANENDAYFYTLRETGKCPSDKTAISLVISYKTTTPTATIADPTWCSGKKVSDLKTYIASKGVTGTIKIYESATATTDLADATVLEKNKSYHFTTHDGNPQHCESNRVALTITIYASPAITTHPVTPSPLCGGSTPTALSVVATGDDISYQWYKNTTNDNTSGTAIAGKTSATFAPPTDTVETTYYYVKVSSGKGCAAAVSNTAKIEVTKPTKITRQPSNIRHCMGTLPPPNRLEVEAERTGTLRYQWYLKNNNYPLGTAVPNVPGNTGQDAFYNPPIDSAHTTTYYVEVTSDCGTVTSNEIVVDIIPYPSFKSGGNLTTNDDATYCKGATSVRKLKVDVQQGAGSPVYQWYKATSPMGTGQEIAQAWSNEYTPDVSEAGTFYYYVTVRNQQYCTEEFTSYKAKIVVNETTAIEDDLSETEVKYCKGATPTALTVKMKGTPNYTYTWYKASNMTETGTVVRTQTSATAVQDSYTPATADEGTFYYYVKVHSSCGDDKTSKRAKITVTKDTAIKTDGNLSTTEVKYCKNTTATALTVKVEGTAPYTYKWYKADNATDAGQEVRNQTNSNSNEDSYTPVVTTVGTAYYYVKITGHCGAEVTSDRAKITVTKDTAIKTDGNLSTTEVKYCKNTTATALTVKVEGTAPYTYKWYKADNATDAGQEVRNQTNSNSNEDSYTPVVTTVGTAYYYVKITGHCGAEVTSDRAKITVTKDTAIKTDGNLSTTEVKYCKNTTATALTVKVEGTAPYTYKWYKADNATDAGQEVRNQTNSNSNEDSYTPVVTTVGTAYYYVKITGHCGAEVTSDRAKITVTKDTAIKTDGNLSTTEVKYCKNTTATALTVKVEGTAPYTYKWYKADSATATGTLIRTENTNSDEDSYTPVVTTVGSSYYYVKISSSCGSDVTSARAHITVQDITVQPTLTAVNLCQGATLADLKAQLALTLTGTLKVYATATDPVDLADGTVLNAATYYYTATETNKCESDRQTMAVTLVQAPTLQATYAYCVGTTVDTLWKAIDANDSDNSIRIYNVATGGTPLTRTDLLSTTTYYVAETASNGGVVTCETSRVATQVTIGSVANPVIATTPATCGVATVVKITNHAPGISYTITDSANATVAGTSVAADGTIGGITSAGTYKIKATQGTCVSGEETFTIAEALPVPETPTVMVAPPTCTAMSAAKVSNYTDYTHGETFTITDSNGTVIGAVDNAGNITGLTTAGTYTLTITRGTCRAAAVNFDIAGKLPTPAKPAITLTLASCTSPTVAKLTQVSELTFWHNGTQLTVNPITHEIMGLAPGTYTITAKNNNNCESVASDSFEIKAQQTATTITTHPARATYQKGAEATPLAVVATGEGTLRYKWYNNTDNNNTSGTEVGDNSPSYKPATDTVGSLYYWVEVTSDCGAVKSNVAEIKVVQGAPTIEANDDPDTTVRRGQEVAVLGNDKVNGNPATPADVDITISNDGGLTRVGVNPATGKIMIPNDAAPATYEITYKICVKNQPTICDEAKVKITVEVPTLALKAVDDDFGKIPNAVDYTTTNTVFSAGVDTMEGGVGNLSPERDVVLTPGAVTRDGAAITEGITMNPNGSITVKRGTPKGTYTYEYTICQKDVPTNCDTAKVSFEVIEAHIFAKDDGVWEVGTEGALTPSVLNNDILGERVGIAPSEVSITKTNGKPVIDDTKMVMNEDGRISVKKGIAEGPYTYYYTITEKANPSNTSSASVTIRVVSFSAQDDEFNITNDKTKEFKTESVLKNDELNKKKNPSPVDDVILTKGEAKDAERNPTTALTMNDDGTITIAPNTPDGVYTYTYTICKKSPPTECKSAEAVIKLLPALIANDDDFTANPINPLVKEGIAGNVLDNDRYADGNALEHLDKVKITMLEGQESRANIEPNGNVVIPQGAPAGEYTLTYSLCMKDHPTICAEAKVKIVILEDKPIVIHNGISANGDGVNDGFMIEHIEGYPKNNLKIFNRWGVLVYEKDGYTNREPFDGHSNGRVTISAESKLPQGTYYYILEYQDTAEQTHTKKGWLYLKY